MFRSNSLPLASPTRVDATVRSNSIGEANAMTFGSAEQARRHYCQQVNDLAVVAPLIIPSVPLARSAKASLAVARSALPPAEWLWVIQWQNGRATPWGYLKHEALLRKPPRVNNQYIIYEGDCAAKLPVELSAAVQPQVVRRPFVFHPSFQFNNFLPSPEQGCSEVSLHEIELALAERFALYAHPEECDDALTTARDVALDNTAYWAALCYIHEARRSRAGSHAQYLLRKQRWLRHEETLTRVRLQRIPASQLQYILPEGWGAATAAPPLVKEFYGSGEATFYSGPFEDAMELFAKRACVLVGGRAWVSAAQLPLVVKPRILRIHQQNWDLVADQMKGGHAVMSARVRTRAGGFWIMVDDLHGTTSSGERPSRALQAVMAALPPCMQRWKDATSGRATSWLKNDERWRFAMFLYHQGVSLDTIANQWQSKMAQHYPAAALPLKQRELQGTLTWVQRQLQEKPDLRLTCNQMAKLRLCPFDDDTTTPTSRGCRCTQHCKQQRMQRKLQPSTYSKVIYNPGTYLQIQFEE